MLSEIKIPICLYMSAEDFLSNSQEIKEIDWNKGFSFNILYNKSSLHNYNKIIRFDFNVYITKTSILASDEEYNRSVELIKMGAKNQKNNILPYFNGNNMDFFKSYVFTSKDEVKRIALSKRYIYIRQSLNIFDFGKLTIMPDGKVYANVNEEPLGTIDDYPYDIVYKEFTAGKSWFNIRNQKPCSDCVYQWLCPSPSNYERAIGKPNLCHIKV